MTTTENCQNLMRILRTMSVMPKWSDLDVNQHVNNVKYVGWILESAPKHVVEDYELASITLEYRRECMKDSVLQSLTSLLAGGEMADSDGVDCQHLLRLEGGGEIVKGRTKWRPKNAQQIQPHQSLPY
uniref:Putative acyl-ACP thioesterase, HotDog domain protein n=1 Tax=Helianthus annuus TaxID=4232 RepID=A0A251V485_HELAN